MKIEKALLREGRQDVSLTAYIVEDSPELLAGTPRPAVLICPGGAYLNCSDREAEPVALRFAAMGYHAFVLRYSVYLCGAAGFPDMGGGMPVHTDTVHPAPVQDIGLAMLYIRRHAAEWRVDAKRIALCGFSAGSHNCAMYAVYWNKPLITDFLGVDAAEVKPAAAILCYGLSDYVAKQDEQLALADEMLSDAANIALFGEKNPDEQKRRALSPALLVDEATPPAFLWATAADALVPVMQSVRMAEGLAVHGIPFELHIFEEGPHGLSLATQASACAKSQINPDAAGWIALAEAWLQKRFALLLPNKTAWEEMRAQ